MATMADELLNDFADGSDSEVDGHDFLEVGTPPDPESDMDVDREAEGDQKPVAEGGYIEAEAAEDMDLRSYSDVKNVAHLMGKLEPVLRKIEHYQSQPPSKNLDVGSIEDNPEYHLLTESNTLSTLIDNEIMLVHKFIRDHYSTRFPALETLITNPLDYTKAVAIIGNGPMENIKQIAQRADNMVGTSLKSILDGPSLMVVTVEGTTSSGRTLTPSELRTVMAACEMNLSLDRAKKILTEYVQSRMNLFAPNLTALIGSLTAAQLLNFAGGLTGLAKTPACNLPPLGSKKQSQTGFATNVGVRQQGFLYRSPIISSIPSDLKRQAMRIVSAKVILAARVDRVHSSPDGSSGEQLKQDCLDRLDKLTEPPPNKGPRALPAPDDKPSRKRGGRRARKAKEATAMTDLRKAQNRMAFGKEEKEVGYGTGEGTKGLGMIGQANEGRIRNLQIDQRTKAKLSKSNKGWGGAASFGGTASSLRGFGQGAGNATTLRANGLRSSGVGGGAATAGIASSINFTPVQGLELVDPRAMNELKRKRDAEQDRWFNSGMYTQIGGGQNALPSGSEGGAGNGGFKVPELPGRGKGNGKMEPPAALAKRS
ncbi:U4/U6-U5 snRNP complex subunit prp31 [Ptychographa xylographoides]|nr:U4/U6-U5 snRNP complex subunit prp31 [Ptychographa xylographoides]